jgi:tRNA pseudouridine65 synthase
MRETLPILYRDDWLIAVDKPAGLLVHRTMLDRHETRFAVQIVRDQIGQHVFPAHRLDRGTSGVLLFTLDRDTCRDVGRQFDSGAVKKTYLAVVRGYPVESGRIDHPLVRRFDDYEFRDESGEETTQEAVTDYRRLATAELPCAVDRYPTSRYALVEVAPQTGRRHQIRRHLKHIAHPIIGDATYGKGRHNRLFEQRFGCRRLLLACCSMQLTHPATGQPLTLTAPLAPDFAAIIKALGWQWPGTATPLAG